MKSLDQPGTRAEIIARVQRVRPEAKAQFGVMSAPEMIKHCVICLEAGLGLRMVSPAETFVGRALMKPLALYMPMHWPPGIKTRPEMNVRSDGNQPGDFVSDVANLVRRLEEFGTRQLNGTWPRHPLFGAMSGSEWQRWAYLHTDHHLRQFSA